MKALKWLDQYIEEIILVALLLVMMIIMGIQVAARYVVGSSLSWSEEITRYSFIWSGFLSASYCIKKGESVKVEQFVNSFSERTTHVLRLFTYAIEILFFIYLIPFAYNYVKAAVMSGQVSPACGIPMYYIQAATLFSFCFCVFRLTQKWIYRLNLVIAKKNKGVVK